MLSNLSSSSRVSGPSALHQARTVLPVQPVQKVGARTLGDDSFGGETDAPDARPFTVTISEEGRALAEGRPAPSEVAPSEVAPSEVAPSEVAPSEVAPSEVTQQGEVGALAVEGELSEEELQTVRDLQARDAEVRTHEQAHKSAGGSYAGSINYDTQRGPDGKSYAVGGSVDIDTSAIGGDPAATIVKMQQVIRAALAPSDPSGADRSVASSAQSKMVDAQRALTQESQTEPETSAVAGSPNLSPRSEPSPTGTENVSALTGSAGPQESRDERGRAPLSLVA